MGEECSGKLGWVKVRDNLGGDFGKTRLTITFGELTDGCVVFVRAKGEYKLPSDVGIHM